VLHTDFHYLEIINIIKGFLRENVNKYDKVLTLAAVKLSFLHPVKKVKLEYKINADF